MIRPSTALWILCSAFSSVRLADASCDQSGNKLIQECVSPVAQYAESLGMGTRASSPQLTNILRGKDVFVELCRRIQIFYDCVRVPRSNCPQHITLRLIDASYGYLCKEGREDFMVNADCLMRLDQQASVRHCHDNTLKVIKTSSEEVSMKLDEKMHRMCQSLNYFAGCVRSPVLDQCGERAWTVINRVLRDTTRTLMPECQFHSAHAPRPTPPQKTTPKPTQFLRTSTTTRIVEPVSKAQVNSAPSFRPPLLILIALGEVLRWLLHLHRSQPPG